MEEVQKMEKRQIGYLFYSNNCQSCSNLIKMLDNNNLLNMFKLKNIDEMTIDVVQACGLTVVPTLLFDMDKNLYELCEPNKRMYEECETFVIVNKLINNLTATQSFTSDNLNLNETTNNNNEPK